MKSEDTILIAGAAALGLVWFLVRNVRASNYAVGDATGSASVPKSREQLLANDMTANLVGNIPIIGKPLVKIATIGAGMTKGWGESQASKDYAASGQGTQASFYLNRGDPNKKNKKKGNSGVFGWGFGPF